MALNHLFLDFNAFFASCEQHLRPDLRARPIGVVAVKAATTCCLAASYEAKKHGVKTGTLVQEAHRLCPGMVFVEARPAEYVKLHNELVEVVEQQMHVEKVHSIDEVSCRLTGHWREPDEACALALRIKAAIRRELGPWLRCSIGLASNIFLAKTATDLQKPDGLVVLDGADIVPALSKLELRDLCGIGRKMKARLEQAGIGTVEQLLAAERGHLRAAWGSVEGERYWAKLRGVDWVEELARTTVVGHSHVLAPELRTEPRAFAVLHRLLQKAAMRLRAKHFFTGELSVSVERLGAPAWEDRLAIEPTQDTLELAGALEQLWARRVPLPPGARPLLVAVTLSRLEHACDHTPSLFQTAANRRAGLLKAVDKLNGCYGHGAIYWAAAHEAGGAAPMRIPFNRIPNLAQEQDTGWGGAPWQAPPRAPLP